MIIHIKPQIIPLLEARAIDRRRDALNKGIAPINGSNWNADRKNPKKVSSALDLANKIGRVDNTITKHGGISPDKEYSGIIQNKNIEPKYIGNRSSVKGVQDAKVSFHKHPNTKRNDASTKGLPIVFPSGEQNTNAKNFLAQGDYNSSSGKALNNKTNRHTEYIFGPNAKSNTVAQINTRVNPENYNTHQKTSYYSNKAKNYYNLNGGIINGGNDKVTTPHLSLDNIPKRDILNSVNNLKNFKRTERLAFHEKNNGDLVDAKNYANRDRNSTSDYFKNRYDSYKKHQKLGREALRTDPMNFDDINNYYGHVGTDFAKNPRSHYRPYRDIANSNGRIAHQNKFNEEYVQVFPSQWKSPHHQQQELKKYGMN